MLAAIAERGAGFRSLADAWADTTAPRGRLMETVLGGLAEFERSLFLARTGEGRSRAMAPGVKFGRKPKLTAHHTHVQAQAIRVFVSSSLAWQHALFLWKDLSAPE